MYITTYLIYTREQRIALYLYLNVLFPNICETGAQNQGTILRQNNLSVTTLDPWLSPRIIHTVG